LARVKKSQVAQLLGQFRRAKKKGPAVLPALDGDKDFVRRDQ
jgi:hypothetical protein